MSFDRNLAQNDDNFPSFQLLVFLKYSLAQKLLEIQIFAHANKLSQTIDSLPLATSNSKVTQLVHNKGVYLDFNEQVQIDLHIKCNASTGLRESKIDYQAIHNKRSDPKNCVFLGCALIKKLIGNITLRTTLFRARFEHFH